MKKKEDVYVVVDTPKKAKKLKRVLSIFDIEWHINQFYGDFNYFYFEDDDLYSIKIKPGLSKVSIQELKNILAAEYLNPGDEVVLGIGDIECNAIFIGMKGLNFEAQYYFNGDIYLEPSIETICFHDFKRYQNKTDDDVAVIERLHDTLYHNHGYSLDSELLTKARKLAIKLRKPH